MIARALRSSLPAIAIAVAVGLWLSDWPIGWHWWVEHPYVAAFVSGFALLFVAGAVIDSHMRRREAHRWHGLGFAAAGEFAAILYDTSIAIAALSGRDDGYRLRSDVEFHLAGARERALALLGSEAGGDGAPADRERRLSILVADEDWRRSCSQTLRVSRSHLVEAVSRWTATFAILNDDEDFNRVARTVTIMDLITALHMALVAARPHGSDAHLDAAALAGFSAQWHELESSVGAELDFWNGRRRLATRIELPQLEPTT